MWPPRASWEVRGGPRGKEGLSPMVSEGPPSKRPSPFPWRAEKLVLLRHSLSYCLVLFSSQIVPLSEIILCICFHVQHLHTGSPSFFSAHLARLRILFSHNGMNEKLPCKEQVQSDYGTVRTSRSSHFRLQKRARSAGEVASPLAGSLEFRTGEK